ncbi:MAG: SurA N-terminal domain-containing protein [Candidatus Hydrogenedentes bacterium]|nr:SurA N-terminal domain-containing protein [Candidatus Hydrogenedentota bacterium]
MSMLMRKYKKQILVVTIALIAIPFVIWGGYRGATGRDAEYESAMAPVAMVEGAPITAAEFRDALNREIQQRKQYGQKVEFDDLLADGTAERVIEALVSRRLLELQAQNAEYEFSKEFLVEQLKKEFKDEEDKFDPERWNAWVKYVNERSGQSWNAIYEDVANQLRRQLMIKEATASARVSEKELKREFEDNHTKLDLKYVQVAPEITPTEEEIRAHYDENPSAYDIPAKRKAEFVAVSLRPPKPALADEIIEKARAGADFVELVKEHSQGADKAEGGDMGWVTKTPQTPKHQQVIFTLQPGEVSDAVLGPGGQYFIYKVEEERKSEVTRERDVKVRRIMLNPKLDPEERAAREEKAQIIMGAAKAAGNLAAAAAEAGLEVQTTDLFGPDSRTIENVPPEDAFRFRTALSELGLEVISEVISGQANLYVAEVVEMTQPEPQPFEAVEDAVREDTIEEIRRSPEYIEKCRELADEIKESVTVLGEIPEKYPDLEAEVKELDGFSRQDYMSLGGLAMNPRQLYTTAKDKSPGDVFGPLQDYMGQTYLLQFVAKHPPTDADWEEKWPEEREQLRERALARTRQERLSDYLRYLRDTHQWNLLEENFFEIFAPPEDAAEETGPEEAASTAESAPDEADASPAPETGEDAAAPTAEVAPEESATDEK